MELLLIRHGQSEADLLGVLEGRADFPLTELGREQARKLAIYLNGAMRPEKIIASPLKRAPGTARILRDVTGAELEVDPLLMEFNNGVLAGMPKEVAAVQYPLHPEGRPAHIPIQDGESELEFRFRAEAFLQKTLTENQNANRVAVVSHGGLISKFLQAFMNMPAINGFGFPTADTGFHLLEINEQERLIWKLNSEEHLGGLR
ncbi:histidine phosphatase family protein [Neobacillus notoginsengisoli]|uniref:Histidine phosphatase family protein n=1 Tax=Neobacillus notoginsengisoli TaxID=1578198 RepID=A0A417YWS9_9BACI|nr:histidine phosphatase family protein [Neobacillus notoginsengisoli]RHW42021.1 histidine phosphatase family protein [Neobacillus notoginsengisoli]